MSVTLDVSKLSGWLKADAPCRVENRAYDAGRGAEREAEGVGAVAAQARRAWRAADLKAGEAEGTRGAHHKHVPHARDLGRVESQRLVEHHRLLPSRKEGIRCGTRCEPEGGRAWGGAGGVQGGGSDSRLGAQGTRGAHVERVVHGCDAGRVEAQRLVERNRALPSQMQGIRCGSRCGAGGERAWGR
eukprot:scaffold39005_cov47-Phaeocystis_antarctica.AAC.1